MESVGVFSNITTPRLLLASRRPRASFFGFTSARATVFSTPARATGVSMKSASSSAASGSIYSWFTGEMPAAVVDAVRLRTVEEAAVAA